MEFNIFTQQENTQNVLPNSFIDQEKQLQIVAKIFEKRKAILWNLANREVQTHTTYLEELKMNDLDMQALGLTKIDYEVYLAKQKETIQ
jgi:hypothetical protein